RRTVAADTRLLASSCRPPLPLPRSPLFPYTTLFRARSQRAATCGPTARFGTAVQSESGSRNGARISGQSSSGDDGLEAAGFRDSRAVAMTGWKRQGGKAYGAGGQWKTSSGDDGLIRS